MKKITWIGFALLIMTIGCTSTSKITSSWKAENVQPGNYNKILVLGLMNVPDRTIREKMEEHLVGDLKMLGYNAICACEEFNPKAFDNMTEEAAIHELKNSGVDAVLTIVLLDKQKERKYVAGSIFYSPYGYYYDHFWGYGSTLYRRIYTPGYYVSDTKYFWESNLYDMATQQLVYSVQTQSFNPDNADALGQEYSKLIIKNMTKQNVLQQQGIKTN
ncbi:MAG TPA: hypothetical protein VIJ75_12450 [Hanamia sp.]